MAWHTSATALFKRIAKALAPGLVLVAGGLALAPSSWAVTFNTVYLDVENSTGAGFDDPLFGTDRRATVTAVTDYLSSTFTLTGSVDLQFTQSQSDGSGPLGTGGTFWMTAPNRFDNGFAFQHASTGTDPFSGVPDAQVMIDFGYSYNLGTGAPAPTENDLFSLLLHEIMHGMGWLTLLQSDGNSRITGGDPGVYSLWDMFVARGNGQPLFGPDGDFIGTASDLTSDDLYYTGSKAVAANGGSPLKLYAPSVFEFGASISHLDPNLFPNAVMTTVRPTGTTAREFTPVEIAILQDLGFVNSNLTVASAVPTPSGMYLIIPGLLLCLLFRAWRRRD